MKQFLVTGTNQKTGYAEQYVVEATRKDGVPKALQGVSKEFLIYNMAQLDPVKAGVQRAEFYGG
jgi:hypothetical protein